MKDFNGNIIVYLGQPWVNPEGELVAYSDSIFSIATPNDGIVDIEKNGFIVSNISYKEFKKARETISGILGKEKIYEEKEYDRFDIMDFDE